ncbi:PREDICTED: neuromedin-U isoform X1 [Thamnophis sirtalis]|uniref:Neuromedin-U isoform X1 n=1 Tax=Thamnophis sirtalis TaxID=35019 RepID=A0A6I9YUC8_9SAUR|nr:PREDICTED: neuromedin-U isoform X1 [Thamnophis sirtalis]
MRRASACRTRPAQQLPWPGRGSRKAGPGTAWRLLFALLAFGVSSCKGVPVMSHVLQGEKVWNEIDAMCSTIPARDPLSQPSNALEEFCFMVLELLQKDKPLVPHPLLPLTPQLHDKRQKRYKADEELRIPGGVQSRGYFMFRPRNGRRSAALY